MYSWLRGKFGFDPKLDIDPKFDVDPLARACYYDIQKLYLEIIRNHNKKEFEEHHLWIRMSNHDSCKSFQDFVKAKGIPKNKDPVEANKTKLEPENKDPVEANKTKSEPPKAIPKKIRQDIWEKYNGNSLKGECFCCKAEIKFNYNWHAGHIVSRYNGGNDSADNLRPICVPCNLSMRTENMADFKERCYPV